MIHVHRQETLATVACVAPVSFIYFRKERCLGFAGALLGARFARLLREMTGEQA